MLAPDTVLQSRYRIVRKLSAGGMGTVYEAIDLRFNSQVALKETHFTEEALRKQFEREAHLLYKLRHPAIARVIDHFVEGEGQFLVMDYIEGEDLSEKLEVKGGAFPVEEVLTWGDQLLDALSYLHKQNPPIIHRDIKPQNLKLTDTGQIILLDFGLAKGFAGQISRVTTSGSIFGYTPNYAPLEQIHGTGTDARSDIYSLAATLYHLLTGKVPPDALSRAMALTNEQPEPLHPANAVNPNVPSEVASVLQKAMAQNANKRFSSAAEMRQTLRDASQSISQGETQRVKPPLETVRGVPPLPLDFVPQFINEETTQERVSTLVAPPPVIPPQQYRDSFPQPVRKSRRSPLARASILMTWVVIALTIGFFIFTIVKRSGNRTGNSSGIYPAITNTSANTSIASTHASNSNQTTNVAVVSSPSATPIPSPSSIAVKNLEGTEWQGKRVGDDGDKNKEHEVIFKFKQNGKMQMIWTSDNDIDDGTWTKDGDKVSIIFTDSISDPIFGSDDYKMEGTIQGEEISGEFRFRRNSNRYRFVVRKTK